MSVSGSHKEDFPLSGPESPDGVIQRLLQFARSSQSAWASKPIFGNIASKCASQGDIFQRLNHAITLGPCKVCCSTVLNKVYIIRSLPIALTIGTRQPATADFPILINLLLFCCLVPGGKSEFIGGLGLINSVDWNGSKECLNVLSVDCSYFSFANLHCPFFPPGLR